METKAFAVIFTALITANVKADSIGLYVGGEVWQSEASGTFGKENQLNDVQSTRTNQYNYSVAFEHPFPLLPNIRIASTSLDTSSQSHSTREYSDDTETAHVDVHVELDIEAGFNVNFVDYTLYYELYDSDYFSLDIGLTARDLSGSATFTETADIVTTTRDFIWDGPEHDDHDYHNIVVTTQNVSADKIKPNDIEPMLYVATNIQLPLTDLSAFAQGNILLTGDHSLYDYQVGLDYDVVHNRRVDFNLLLGYRIVRMELEDLRGLYSELDFKGAFVGVIAHF